MLLLTREDYSARSKWNSHRSILERYLVPTELNGYVSIQLVTNITHTQNSIPTKLRLPIQQLRPQTNGSHRHSLLLRRCHHLRNRKRFHVHASRPIHTRRGRRWNYSAERSHHHRPRSTALARSILWYFERDVEYRVSDGPYSWWWVCGERYLGMSEQAHIGCSTNMSSDGSFTLISPSLGSALSL